MPDSPAVKSAKGHVELYEDFVQKTKKRLETGDYMDDEAYTRKLLDGYESKLDEWRKNLERAEKEATSMPPLM